MSLDFDELKYLKKTPDAIYHKGNLGLLKRKKVSIVGTRRPNQYTKEFTFALANELTKRDIVIVSGAAMGVDAIAHRGAKANNTIAVVANGLDIKYPAVNKQLILDIEQQGLILSTFQEGFRATRWSFVVRNELVVALGDVLIVSEADLNSGSMRSVEFALSMGKEIFVLPHRVNESLGTNYLLKEGKAKPIYDIEEFVNTFGKIKKINDDFLEFIQQNNNLDDVIAKFGDRVYEAELEGIIAINNANVVIL